MIDEKRIKRFIEGAKEAFKEVDDTTFTFPMNILSAYELATSIEELLKKQEAVAPTIKINVYGTRFYYCPNCNREFYCHNQWDNYCANCGQAVKWE